MRRRSPEKLPPNRFITVDATVAVGNTLTTMLIDYLPVRSELSCRSVSFRKSMNWTNYEVDTFEFGKQIKKNIFYCQPVFANVTDVLCAMIHGPFERRS
jgi:hypothetical protein